MFELGQEYVLEFMDYSPPGNADVGSLYMEKVAFCFGNDNVDDFNSRRCERQPLNLLKAVVHNNGHCQPIHKRISFGIILKPRLNFGFFF